MNIRKKLRLQRRAKMAAVLFCFSYMVFGIITYITAATSLEAGETTQTAQRYDSLQQAESPQPTQVQIVNKEGQTEHGTELSYPFNTMSFDWSGEQIAGFKEYNMPEDYELYGGCFPLEMQQYTYVICKQNGVDYSLILAMIEIESGYRYDAFSRCNAVGYMQIVECWHKERMAELNVSDLENPYQNIRVGIDCMAELLGQYQTSVALSVYNRGTRNSKGTGAVDLAEKGQYQTEYSEAVLSRAAEIEKELELSQ